MPSGPVPPKSAMTTSTTVAPEWLSRIAGTPISPVTLLATDYLNHFNEVIMLIGMIPSMPEILDDVLAWKSKTYPEHFRAINLDYGQLAAEAYDHAPALHKEPFEMTTHNRHFYYSAIP